MDEVSVSAVIAQTLTILGFPEPHPFELKASLKRLRSLQVRVYRRAIGTFGGQ
jgi:hypothetical protein